MSNSGGKISFLKEIVAIITGLSITSAVQRFVPIFFPKGALPQKFSEEYYYYVIIFILLLLNVIRFFYGYWMFIDKAFSNDPGSKQKKPKFSWVFLMVILQSIIFSMLILQKYETFFHFFAAAILIDLVGFSFVGFSLLPIRNYPRETYWIITNALSIIILLIIFLLGIEKNNQFIFCSVFSAMNTIVVLALSWQLYIDN